MSFFAAFLNFAGIGILGSAGLSFCRARSTFVRGCRVTLLEILEYQSARQCDTDRFRGVVTVQ